MHARALACLYPGYCVLKYQPLPALRSLRLAHTTLPRLALANVAPEHPRCRDEENVRVRLTAAGLDESVVRADDAPLEEPEECIHQVRALLLVVASLRASRYRDGNMVLVQMLHELEDTREWLDGRPERVLAYAALLDVVIDGEVRGQVRKEGKEVLCGLTFGC